MSKVIVFMPTDDQKEKFKLVCDNVLDVFRSYNLSKEEISSCLLYLCYSWRDVSGCDIFKSVSIDNEGRRQ